MDHNSPGGGPGLARGPPVGDPWSSRWAEGGGVKEELTWKEPRARSKKIMYCSVMDSLGDTKTT